MSKPMFVVATSNAGKLREFQAILGWIKRLEIENADSIHRGRLDFANDVRKI